MATYSQWKDIEAIAKSVREAKPRLLHIVREIWLHDRGDGSLCPCGCASRDAVRIERRPHIEVLIDRVTGMRRIRKPHNAAAFDRVAQRAQRMEMPLRCYGEQLDAIIDYKHKIIAAFGGNRAGKSEVSKEFIVDRWCLLGGRKAQLWWVAPTREKTRIGVRKLVLGERTNRFVRPAFPRELVRYWPKTEQATPQKIVLVDGTEIHLKYAGRKGGNLKGDSAQAVVLDEGAEVAHEINWTILVNRTMESGGQLLTSTTPVAGHWLKTLADQGVPYHMLTPELEADGIERVTVTLSCLRNPWISEKNVAKTIKALGGPDDPRVKREVYGLWVAEGNILWRHWAPRVHMIEGIGDVPSDFGYVNVTSIAVRGFLPRGARCDFIGGWDCNDFPQSLVLCYVVVREDEDQGDPANWTLLVVTEIVKPSTIIEWGKYLATKAAKLRGKPDTWIRGLPIVADCNTCYEDTRVNQHGKGADAEVLRGHGFVVEPPAWTQPSPDKPASPANPSIRERVRVIHRLMHEQKIRVHGDCRKLLEAIEGQICDDRGLPVKESGKASDRLSGPADALGYLAYKIFHGAHKPEEGGVTQWQ